MREVATWKRPKGRRKLPVIAVRVCVSYLECWMKRMASLGVLNRKGGVKRSSLTGRKDRLGKPETDPGTGETMLTATDLACLCMHKRG